MADRLVYDTNAVIRILNGSAALESLSIDDTDGQAVSVITRIELLAYPDISVGEERDIGEFLSGVDVIPLTGDVENEAIQLRRAYRRLKLPDAVIDATALVWGGLLITGDPHLLSLNWPGLRVKDI